MTETERPAHGVKESITYGAEVVLLAICRALVLEVDGGSVPCNASRFGSGGGC